MLALHSEEAAAVVVKSYFHFVFFDELNGIVYHEDNDPMIRIVDIREHVVSNTEEFSRKIRTEKKTFFFQTHLDSFRTKTLKEIFT